MRCARGRLKEFGADLAVDSSDPGWVDQVLKATDGEGVDLIVDQVSGQGRRARISRRPRSRAASSMSAGSAAPTPISTSTCMPRAASTISASPSAPARSRKSARSLTRCRKDIWPAVGSRKLQLPIDKVLCIRRHRQGVRAHGSQQAPRQDRGDAVAAPAIRPAKASLSRRLFVTLVQFLRPHHVLRPRDRCRTITPLLLIRRPPENQCMQPCPRQKCPTITHLARVPGKNFHRKRHLKPVPVCPPPAVGRPS